MAAVSVQPACPRCGAESPPGAERCSACGFAFFQRAERRRLPWRLLGGAALMLVLVAVAILAATREREPEPPGPVGAREAERRLELRFARSADDETAAIRCPGPIGPSLTVRCELRYADGIARALMVRLTPAGELDANVPYPATLRGR